MIISKTNSIIIVNNTLFEDNFSLGRGSIAFADNSGSQQYYFNCTFRNNYAIKGGVAFSHIESVASFDNCTFESNFAE